MVIIVKRVGYPAPSPFVGRTPSVTTSGEEFELGLGHTIPHGKKRGRHMNNVGRISDLL
jgi:hypothetical protein